MYDEPIEERISALHAEAEDLADLAHHTEDPDEVQRLRTRATELVREAARLRPLVREES